MLAPDPPTCSGDGDHTPSAQHGGYLTGVQFGVTMFATDQTIGMIEFARAVEDRGLSSLYLPEHTHIPTSRRTPPPTGDDELAEEYKRTIDPFVALAMAAAVTERLVVGTGICLVAQREPIVTAKAVATLDTQSGGRFVFGVGFGWNEDEAANHGVDMPTRRDRARSTSSRCARCGATMSASSTARTCDLAASWSWPKPATSGGPPVLIGGAAGPKLFAHIAEYGDGWIPIGGAGVREALPELQRAMRSARRDPAVAADRAVRHGPVAGKVEYYASLGINEIVLRIPSGDRNQVLPRLDRYAELVGS